MDTSEMLPFKDTLVGFTGEQVQVLGHKPVVTVFGSGDNVKSVKVRYLIMSASSLHNIIIEKLTFNAIEAALSILYLMMKYSLCGGGIRVIKGGQGLEHKCYNDN